MIQVRDNAHDIASDIQYMQLAIRLARKGRYTTSPNPNVGCVVVKDNIIVGQGWHQRAGESHAEVIALRAAGDRTAGSTVYVTLEPCSHTGKTPPCADALIKAGVAKVVVAMKDPNPLVAGSGLSKLEAAGIKTEVGCLEQQARDVNPGFIKRMEAGRPYVRVKLAMSMDGRTAMASGESQWISGEASRLDVQRFRAESSAILTGIETVLADDPSMNVRASTAELQLETEDKTIRQPLRVVVDSKFRMPDESKISSLDGDCLVYTAAKVENSKQRPYGVETIVSDKGLVDLHQLMNDLAAKEINLLHVEAGSVLSGALLKNDLVDEIIIYMAPHIMGHGAKGLFHLPGLENMNDRVSLNITDIRSIGNDIRITAQPEKGV